MCNLRDGAVRNELEGFAQQKDSVLRMEKCKKDFKSVTDSMLRTERQNKDEECKTLAIFL